MKLVKLYSLNNKDQIKLLVELTDSCNYLCNYCYNEKPRKNQHLNSDRLIEFIQYIHQKTNRNIKVELIGGEPTLHLDLLPICQKLFSYDYIDEIELYTNFHKPIEFYDQLTLSKRMIINATWHSLETDRQNNNFYEKVKYIKSQNLCQYYFIVMLENDNFQNSINMYQKLYNYIEKTDIDNLSHLEMSLCIYGDGTQYSYSQNELEQFEKLNQKQIYDKQFIFEFDTRIKKEATIQDIEKLKTKSFKYWKCNAGKDYLYVHCNGNVYKCDQDLHNNKPIGNINNKFDYDFKPTICKYSYCPWNYEIFKERIF